MWLQQFVQLPHSFATSYTKSKKSWSLVLHECQMLCTVEASLATITTNFVRRHQLYVKAGGANSANMGCNSFAALVVRLVTHLPCQILQMFSLQIMLRLKP